jgi:hypothetical protein
MAIDLYSKATLDTLLADKLSVISLSNGQAGALDPAIPTNGMALTFDSTYGLKWATVTASAAWGGITGTVTDQTDLTTYLSSNYYPASNPSGFISSVPAKSVNTYYSNPTLSSVDANQIVNLNGASGVTVPQDSTYDFAIGTVIIVCNSYTGGMPSTGFTPEDTMMGVPTIVGPSSSSNRVFNLVKVAANTWCVD